MDQSEKSANPKLCSFCENTDAFGLNSKSDLNNSITNGSRRNLGLVFAGITGVAAVAISVICFPFVSPALRKVCLPYVPATDQQISNVLKILNGRNGKTIDLGSGDGRIVFSIAQLKRNHVTGIELNPWLVLYSKFQARVKKLSNFTTFSKQDLWQYGLQPYQNIIIFGIEEMMPDLEKKLEFEMNGDARVIACRFPLPGWIPLATVGEGIDTVWIYSRKTTQVSNI